MAWNCICENCGSWIWQERPRICEFCVCAIFAIGIYAKSAPPTFPRIIKRRYEVPILPENKKRYPDNWKAIKEGILAECKNKCEFCGVENYALRDGAVIVLTIAHLDYVPENCARENLRALCQKCHNKHDAKHRAETRKRRLRDYEKAQYVSELFQEQGAI
jgi:5-methylcytosine-specific restriction endonuclease McrA